MPVEEMLDVLSVLDKNEEPIFSNCTLQMGELALEFKNGRSKVPFRHAAEALRHPSVLIPGYTGPAAPMPPNESAELPEIPGDVRQHQQETPAQREARISAAEEYLRSQGLDVPVREAPSVEDPEVLKAKIAELEGMLANAADLQAVKEVAAAAAASPGAPSAEIKLEAGEIEPKLPEGFDAVTADGKPRCWSRKGDGTQCSNASSEGSHACNLKAHQKLVK